MVAIIFKYPYYHNNNIIHHKVVLYAYFMDNRVRLVTTKLYPSEEELDSIKLIKKQ